MDGVYTPKDRKHAGQIMKMHTDMGDEIIILEDWDGTTETQVTEAVLDNSN